MGAQAAAVAVENLSMEFVRRGERLLALQDIDLDVAPSELFVIVGPSGCGKTTLLRIVQGLAKATRGRILVGGKAVSAPGTDRGFVFQQDALYPWRSVLRNVCFGLELQGVPKAQARARAQGMIELVGLSGFESHYPHELSGGMRQRVMIAIAIACDPKLIIADEPTTALDVTIQAQILELMNGLTRRLNAALIIITHNLGVVARYAKRVNVMYAGRIVESGPAAAIYHTPRHPYTMALLRSVPRLDRPRRARLDPVDGQPPDLTRLDQGCAFRPRCRFAIEACAKAWPPLEPVGPARHLCACLRGHEIGAATGAAA